MANLKYEIGSNDARAESLTRVDMKLEVVVIPVSDVDRAKKFYGKLGWRLVATFSSNFRKEIAMQSTVVKNVVLVHGGFVDGSGWQGVYKALKKSGYAVTIVQNPTFSLADDVAVTKRALATQNGPVILVGHSYGGVVITEAGNDPKVAGLVYIAAFAPDKGESVSALIKDPPPWRTGPTNTSAAGWISVPR
jgi:pimeloyl-ACP methyl ester carboxylesterase